MNYNIGDEVTYQTFGGGTRRVKVTDKDPDIKNGRAGFDGRITQGGEVGQSVWGYDDQILMVHRQREVYPEVVAS